MRKPLLLNAFLIATSCLVTMPVEAAEPGQDLRFLSRYPGSTMIQYKRMQYDEATMPLGPIDEKGVPVRSQAVEGQVTWIAYLDPLDRSDLEIFRNYENTLRNEGFQVVWKCANNSCNRENGTGAVLQVNPVWRHGQGLYTFFGGNDGSGRMLTAKHVAGTGQQTWIFLRVEASNNEHRADIYAVRVGQMQTGLVSGDADALNAASMSAALQQRGHFSMHLPFDYNQATLKPEAMALIQQLAAVLQQDPGLRVGLDGYTDNIGSVAFNQSLSARRAAAVKTALGQAGVPAAQVATRGLGAANPIADNSSETGRAQNRRVEVINLTPGFAPSVAQNSMGKQYESPGMGSVRRIAEDNAVAREGQSVAQTAVDTARSAVNYQVGQAVWGAVSGLLGR